MTPTWGPEKYVPPPTTPPKGGSGISRPSRRGAMAESVRNVPVMITTQVRGIHRVLCALGLHAWQTTRGTATIGRLHASTRCAVCRVPRG